MGIRVCNVSKIYSGIKAVDDITLDVKSNSLVALLGPSGCGKSTLLRMIAGLEQPDGGRIWINGDEATDRSVQERQVGFVFQHFALFKHRTVRQNIAFGLEMRRWSRDKVRWRVEELLNLVQLQGFGNRYPSQLSGGQRQRVSLARALAVEPQVLLLDEPFSALDAKVRKELRGWLRNLHEQTRVTTIIVTHDQDEAFEVADQVVVINAGKVEQIGSPAEIYEHPASRFALNFIGEVNVIPGGDSLADNEIFVRPHDLELLDEPQLDSLPAVLKRLTHLGRDLYAELILDTGHKVTAQLSRGSEICKRLSPGERMYVLPRRARSFH